MKSLFLEELLHNAVRQFFFVPLALFAQECYTLAIKDSALSAGFSEIRKSAYANRTDRIFSLILAIASLTVGPRVALFVDRWMRRANRANAMAARRRAEYAAQMAAERDAMLKRFRTASTVFGVGILLVLVYALGFRPIDTPPQIYKAPRPPAGDGRDADGRFHRPQDPAGAGAVSGADCIRAKDGLLYAAAWNGAALKSAPAILCAPMAGTLPPS